MGKVPLPEGSKICTFQTILPNFTANENGWDSLIHFLTWVKQLCTDLGLKFVLLKNSYLTLLTCEYFMYKAKVLFAEV